ncbi:MAG: dihydrofolate reductase [Gammaproteobacteria bacterium]
MKLSLIAAVSRNGVIGDGRKMPWHLPVDLRYFKQVTQGKIVIMGRKTYDSIGRPLPERYNIVISRQAAPLAFQEHGQEHVQWVASPEDALSVSQCRLNEWAIKSCPTINSSEVMVIGGGQIYNCFFPLAERLYLTRVDVLAEGETRFPEIDLAPWRCVSRDSHQADHANPFDCEFVVFERRAEGLADRVSAQGVMHDV